MFDALPPVLDTAAMREADRRTIEEFGLPGFTLMELAGRAVADEAAVMMGDDERGPVAILCGKGNNGGDGFVAARVLRQNGFLVDVCLFADPEQLSGDAGAHYRLLASVMQAGDGLRIIQCASEESLSAVESASLYVDALLGTGLANDVREPLAAAIEWLQDRRVPVLAVDLPSGLHSDDGRVLGTAVRADVTVTMGALKAGLLVNEGPDQSGSIVVADIGIPDHILRGVTGEGSPTALCRDHAVRRLLPERSRRAHKYDSGPTLVLGGSPDFPGAPVLAATAAARIGSGYVVVLCPESIAATLSEKLTEIPVAPLSPSNGSWDFQAAIEKLGPRWAKAKSLLVGPGIGRDARATSLVIEMLERTTVPTVVDADALFILQDRSDFVRNCSAGRWIFTPHAGEFARLHPEADVSPIRAAREFARSWNVVVLLKGMPSVTAAPDGRVVVNDTGNAAAATAGTGDVLAGMAAGLLAQGLEPFEAAFCAVHIGGSIADEWVETRDARSMMASDVLAMIPAYLKMQD